MATVCRYSEYISKIPVKFNYFDSPLVYVMSAFVRYSLCTLCYIYIYIYIYIYTHTHKDKENYGTSSEVHKTITAGGTVLKSILILHLADVENVPTGRWCEDSKKEKYLSINIRKITPELLKLRVSMFFMQRRAKLSCHLSQSSPLRFLIHCTRL
jgi:hypothetical protein